MSTNKKKYAIIISIIFICSLIIGVVIYFISRTTSNINNPETAIDVTASVESEETKEDTVKEKKELYLMDYEDLIDNQVTREDIFGKESGDSSEEDNLESDAENASQNNPGESNKASKDSSSASKSNANQNNVSKEKGVTIVDESPNTMRDETIHNEYEVEKSQTPIDFFDVKPSGTDVNGDVPAGGKQDVGTWN